MSKPLEKDSRWFCDHCHAEQWNASVIYGVPVCYICLPVVAADTKYFYHLQAKNYYLEQDRETLRKQLARASEQLLVTRKAFALAVAAHGGELRLPLEPNAQDIELTRWDDPSTYEAVYRVKGNQESDTDSRNLPILRRPEGSPL